MLNKVRGRDVDFFHQDLAVVKTDDGSHTLYHSSLDETYHSLSGAITESLHVFIRAGFLHCLKTHPNKNTPFNVLELGWGTGLNSLLTMEKAITYKTKVRYLGFEPYPLPQKIVNHLNYSKFLDSRVNGFFPDIHKFKENVPHQLNPFFSLTKLHIRLADWSQEDIAAYIEEFGKVDIVYFDAFGLSKQSEPWEERNFNLLAGMMAEQGVLVTYASNSWLKERLSAERFRVDIIPGPPPKREMTRATSH